jgi:hypothetical protein
MYVLLFMFPPPKGSAFRQLRLTHLHLNSAISRTIVVKHFAEHPELGVDLKYSTLSQYFDALSATSGPRQDKLEEKGVAGGASSGAVAAAAAGPPVWTFPLYTGDFFPYADHPDAFWTGYYTSRPLLKAASRSAINGLRGVEILHSLTRAKWQSRPSLAAAHGAPAAASANNAIGAASVSRAGGGDGGTGLGALLPDWAGMHEKLSTIKRDAALVLHHDAITGTSRGDCYWDYLKRLEDGKANAAMLVQQLAHLLMLRPNSTGLPVARLDRLSSTPLTLTPLAASAQHTYPVVVHNSLGWTHRSVVFVPVGTAHVTVVDSSGAALLSQTHPLWEGTGFSDRFHAVFVADCPPLGASTYFVTVHRDAAAAAAAAVAGGYEMTSAAESELLSYKTARPSSPGPGLRGGGAGGTPFDHPWASKPLDAAGWRQGVAELENELYRIEFNGRGMIKTVRNKRLQLAFKVDQTMARFQTQRSGAYIFRALGEAEPYEMQDINIGVSHGSLCSEVRRPVWLDISVA